MVPACPTLRAGRYVAVSATATGVAAAGGPQQAPDVRGEDRFVGKHQVDTQPGVPSLLRVLNDRSALELLLTVGPITRAELGRRTGLSRVTASQSLGRLQSRGLVEVIGRRSAGRGPNAELYAIPSDVGYAVGVDLRPQTVAVAVAGVTGETRVRRSGPVGGGGPGLAEAAADMVRDALADAGADVEDLLAVVVGTPGVIDPRTDEVAFGYDLADAAPHLRASLQDLLDLRVWLDNDVNCAAVAEQRLGAASGDPDFVLAWFGTGVGLAVVVDGRVHRGATGAAGEIGYLPVPGVTLPERVDHVSQGSFQRLAGAQGLAGLAASMGIDLGPHPGAAAVADAVAEAAAGSNEPFLDAVARRVSLGIASVCTVLDPGLVVLSGDIGLAGGEALARSVAAHVERIAPVHPRVVPSSAGESAVLHGATIRAVQAAGETLMSRLDAPLDE